MIDLHGVTWHLINNHVFSNISLVNHTSSVTKCNVCFGYVVDDHLLCSTGWISTNYFPYIAARFFDTQFLWWHHWFNQHHQVWRVLAKHRSSRQDGQRRWRDTKIDIRKWSLPFALRKFLGQLCWIAVACTKQCWVIKCHKISIANTVAVIIYDGVLLRKLHHVIVI